MRTALKERLWKHLQDRDEYSKNFVFEISDLKADLTQMENNSNSFIVGLEAKIEDNSNSLKVDLAGRQNACTNLMAKIEDNSDNLKAILRPTWRDNAMT